jgi:hypothetical protein
MRGIEKVRKTRGDKSTDSALFIFKIRFQISISALVFVSVNYFSLRLSSLAASSCRAVCSSSFSNVLIRRNSSRLCRSVPEIESFVFGQSNRSSSFRALRALKSNSYCERPVSFSDSKRAARGGDLRAGERGNEQRMPEKRDGDRRRDREDGRESCHWRQGGRARVTAAAVHRGGA